MKITDITPTPPEKIYNLTVSAEECGLLLMALNTALDNQNCCAGLSDHQFTLWSKMEDFLVSLKQRNVEIRVEDWR